MPELSRQTVLAGLRAATRLRAGFLPSDVELAGAPVLTLWTYAPLYAGFYRLAGIVMGHPTLPDGSCFTSAVLAIDTDLKWARTVSRLYRLGQPLGETPRELGVGS